MCFCHVGTEDIEKKPRPVRWAPPTMAHSARHERSLLGRRTVAVIHFNVDCLTLSLGSILFVTRAPAWCVFSARSPEDPWQMSYQLPHLSGSVRFLPVYILSDFLM